MNETGVYARQEPLGLSVPKRVGIVGVGGVGSWLAYFLALAGVETIYLWDHDIVSEHNLNRLPLKPWDIGRMKSEAIANLIREARPDAKAKALGLFAEGSADLEGLELDWVVAGTDTLRSRQMVAKWAKEKGVKYLEIAAEGEIGSVTGEPADWATTEEEHPGYQSVPVWVGPCTLCASVAAAHILHGEAMEGGVYRMGWDKDKKNVEMRLL
jgi:glycine/D-amino acid oxidase-like deaminating enzyme